MEAREVLKKYFGYDSFKPGQEEVVEAILAGRDVLGIMPTGAGKSICYQVPALLLPGITIVISPLISLMQDQVKALNDAGIHAGYINSSLTEGQIARVYANAARGVYKILYVAPERLESVGFVGFAEQVEISMVTVDEAHCISQWGQDFRPSYLKIVDFIEHLAKRPVVSAFTATATGEVKVDICGMLGLVEPKMVVTGFDRENLFFEVEAPRKKDEFVMEFIHMHLGDSGIIYCATRKNVDALHELLVREGIPAAKYHAGMEQAERKKNQEDFIYDRRPVIVATNAFGMGIDKSNVRFVLHYNMPQSMENYYQEAGRAGRDGEAACCVLLFGAADSRVNRILLENKEFTDVAEEDVPLIRKRDARRLQVMEGYARTPGCLRNYILEYFGEMREADCGNCGNCQRDYKDVDMTWEAKQVVNCVWEMRGRYGIAAVIGTLVGAKRKRLKEIGAMEFKTYGVLKEYADWELRVLISQMMQEGYLRQTADQYCLIRMGDIERLLDPGTKVMVRMYRIDGDDRKKAEARMKKNVGAERSGRSERSEGSEWSGQTEQSVGSERSGQQTAVKSKADLTEAEREMFEVLRVIRREIAKEEMMPPYIIFSDKTLVDMCVKMPRDKEGMLNVLGVGEIKFEKYGERFMKAIGEFLAGQLAED